MRALLFGALLALLAGCTRDVEPYTSEPLSDYLPLSVGRSITYQLDSTVFIGFTLEGTVHHYQEKQEVAEQITDNLGRPSYRINRYIRDSAGTGNWEAAGTFFITPLEKSIEVVQNNLRVVRLAAPVKRDVFWKGNQYLPFAPYSPRYDFRSDTNFDPSDWEFYYETVGESVTLNGQVVENVITVKQIDEETAGNDDVLLTGKTYAVDKYAKGIGLVYQELTMWEREPNGGADAYKIGFGVTRTLLEHN